jgi:hypothetical protein
VGHHAAGRRSDAPAAAGARIVQVTCTFVAASGEESGAPLGAWCSARRHAQYSGHEDPAVGGPARGLHALYVTDLDGTEFFQQVDVPAGVTSLRDRAPLCLGQQLTRNSCCRRPRAG